MNPDLPSLQLAERQAAGILADAISADTEAQAVQERAANAYKGDDVSYKAVEKADAQQRRTGLDLRLARERHDAAKGARIECETKLDEAEARRLSAELEEGAWHVTISPLVARALDLNAKLCALHVDFVRAIEQKNAKIRRLNELNGRRFPGYVSAPLRAIADAAWLVSALVSESRRANGQPCPSDDVSKRVLMGELPEHLIVTRAPAAFSATYEREAEAEAKRYTSTTTITTSKKVA